MQKKYLFHLPAQPVRLKDSTLTYPHGAYVILKVAVRILSFPEFFVWCLHFLSACCHITMTTTEIMILDVIF